PGTYQITTTQPPPFVDGAANVGSLGGQVSGPDSVLSIIVRAGEFGLEYDFGELGLQPPYVSKASALNTPQGIAEVTQLLAANGWPYVLTPGASANAGAPILIAPSGTIATNVPVFVWTAVAGADPYEIWVDDITTGESQILSATNLKTTSWTATTALRRG